MKKFYFITIGLLLSTTSFAGTITATNSNNWTNTNTWNPQRIPGNNDTIVIPSGISISLGTNENLSNVVIQVYGVLSLNNGKLALDSSSRVIIEANGQLTGQNSNDQINIGTVLKYSGKQGNVYGYAYADNTTGTSPSGFTFFSLPVHFTSFFAALSGDNIELHWSTDMEENNDHFEIERSTDGNRWTKIGTVNGSGNSASSHSYGFTDSHASAGDNYYRIRQVDINGQAFYSGVRMLKAGSVAAPARILSINHTIRVDFNSPVSNNIEVKVLSLNGQVVARRIFSNNGYQISLPANNLSGLFVVQVSDHQNLMQVQKVIL